MDIASIGAAVLLSEGAAASATAAAAQAREAAGLANQAKRDADEAATSATNAAAAANQAAANYGNLDKDAVIDRNAFNYAYTLLQAELRDVQKRLAAAETKLKALT